jgi:hypothetical protein
VAVLWFDSTARLAVADVADTLTKGEKDDLEQAAIENERSKTVYGDGLPDDYRENSE